MSDNRELAEKLMDANDMRSEMKTKDDWLEEIHNENYGNIEQLQSDIEDLKDELKNWKSIADKDRIELEHWKEEHAKLKKIIKTVEDRYSTNWIKQTE